MSEDGKEADGNSKDRMVRALADELFGPVRKGLLGLSTTSATEVYGEGMIEGNASAEDIDALKKVLEKKLFFLNAKLKSRKRLARLPARGAKRLTAGGRHIVKSLNVNDPNSACVLYVQTGSSGAGLDAVSSDHL